MAYKESRRRDDDNDDDDGRRPEAGESDYYTRRSSSAGNTFPPLPTPPFYDAYIGTPRSAEEKMKKQKEAMTISFSLGEALAPILKINSTLYIPLPVSG